MPDSRYHSPLRDRQRDQTRSRILEAAAAVVESAGVEALSFARIAKEAGVQERTVYRHFANRDALLQAFWHWVNERAGITGFPRSEAALLAAPPRSYTGFDRNANLIRALLSTPQGREFRLRVNGERQAALRQSLGDILPGLPERQQIWLCAAVQLLYSATGWATMKDYWGLEGEEAGRAASWAIRTLLDSVRSGTRPDGRTPGAPPEPERPTMTTAAAAATGGD